MKCPTLAELPPPAPGKTGWPWTVGTDEAPPSGRKLPRISIVTPSYMQGGFIEETIRSILLQGYPDIEYIVFDGGSTDGTKAVLEKYSPWLAHWRIEKDRGQSDAINKGMDRATGNIVAYLNSDDWYTPGAFLAVAQRAVEHPAEDWWVGGVDVRNGERCDLKTSGFTSMPRFLGRVETLYQPGVFWSARVLRAVPHFDPTLHCVFDHEYWCRALVAGFRPVVIEPTLANFRIHGESKSSTKQQSFMRELWQVTRMHRARLTASEWREAAHGLRVYEADYLITSIYALLEAGERAAAAGLLLRSVRLYRHVLPVRAVAGAYYRTFVTGAAPEWFRRA